MNISLLAFGAAYAGANVTGSYLYNLSDFGGNIPYDWSRLAVDRERDEVYVLYKNYINVFNSSGMQVYTFGDDEYLGHIIDVAIDRKGDILLLVYENTKTPVLIHCNFRGVPASKKEISDLYPEFPGFRPNRMIYRNGNLYLASTRQKKIVVTDPDGNFREGYDIEPMLELSEEEKKKVIDIEMIGFSVDSDGNMLFTIPVLFKVFILSPDRKLAYFGKPGGAPGKFGILGGVIRDSQGNFIVTDKLKATVMVFDRDYNYITQFGFYGLRPENLVAPDDIVIDRDNRLYITQGRRRGVSVYKLTYD